MARPLHSVDKRKRKRKSFWQVGEVELLRSHYGSLTCRELCRLLNKSKDCIRSKLRQLNIRQLGIKQCFDISDIHQLNYQCGVYAIYNNKLHKYYIGSSTDIGARLYQHVCNLRSYKHDNVNLQNDWDEQHFQILLLILTCEADLIKQEEVFISLLRDSVYNTWQMHKYLPPTILIEDKFWNKVQKSDQTSCWKWCGGFRGDGYGRFYYNDIEYVASRIAYWLHYKVNPNGSVVRHKCNNKRCCNPHHLILGSYRDNAKDHYGEVQVARQRFYAVPRRRLSKLSKHAETVKQLRESGLSFAQIGQRFGLGDMAVYKFVRQRWPECCRKHTTRKHPIKVAKPRGMLLTAFGESKTVKEWLLDARCACSDSVLRTRVMQKWPIEAAITTPMSHHGGKIIYPSN